jgi:hypothetical protein
MEITKNNVTDWIQLLFIVFGGLYALYLLRQSNRDKRNKFVLDIIDRFFDDNEIKTILYSVDQGRDIDEIKFGGKLEHPADKTIKYIDYLGRLLKQGDLKQKDIVTFRYEIKRILESKGVQNYIEWLLLIGVNLDNLKNFDYLKQIRILPRSSHKT